MKIELDKVASAEALSFLKNYPQLLRTVIKTALYRIGTEMQDMAVNLAPYKSGTLRRSVGMDLGTSKVAVGSDLVYARIQDQGGTIKPKRKKYLRFQIRGKWVTVKQVTIPKYNGKGYLTPAYNKQEQSRAEDIFREEFDRILK